MREKLRKGKWKNLAPDLVRQRLVIEGTTNEIAKPEQMKDYLIKLAEEVDMEIMSGPFAYSAHEMGYGGWIHWKSSGAHIYSYPTKKPLITVDIYTCKPFSPAKALKFTKKYFSILEVAWKEVKVDNKYRNIYDMFLFILFIICCFGFLLVLGISLVF